MTTVSKWFAELFGFGLKGAKAEAAKKEETSKAEVSVIKKSSECGCGRSPTGSCLGLHKLTEEEWASHEVNPNRVIEKPKATKDKTAAKKPAAVKKPAAGVKSTNKKQNGSK
jgi:hypothetical protein